MKRRHPLLRTNTHKSSRTPRRCNGCGRTVSKPHAFACPKASSRPFPRNGGASNVETTEGA